MAIDFDTLFGGDDYDPCEALKAIRPALMKQTVNGSVQEIKYRDRTVRFHPTDLQDLRALVSQLEEECRLKSGDTSERRRRAISAGTRPYRYNLRNIRNNY